MSRMKTARSSRSGQVAWSSDLAIVAPAVICPMVMWLWAVVWADVELTVETGNRTREVGAVAVAVTGGLSALAAVSVLRAMERRTSAALRIWTVMCALGFVVSLLGPAAATSWEAAGTLTAMHAIVAVVIIASGRRTRGDTPFRHWR